MKRVFLLLSLLLPLALWAQKKSTPVAGFTVKGQVCAGDTVQFTNTANSANVYYDFADGTDTRKENPLHIFFRPGNYLVKQTAILDGQSATFEFTVVVSPAPEFTLVYNPNAVNDTVRMWIGQNLTITVAENFPTYNWYRFEEGQWASKSASNAAYTTAAPGAFKVHVRDGLGCSAEKPFWILTSARPDDINLTTIIFENNIVTRSDGINDGINDVLMVKYLGDPDIYTKPLLLKLYNKAGVLVYENDNYANEWNGVDSSGGELPTGTYYYVAQSDGRRGKAGFVDLIRSK